MILNMYHLPLKVGGTKVRETKASLLLRVATALKHDCKHRGHLGSDTVGPLWTDHRPNVSSCLL